LTERRQRKWHECLTVIRPEPTGPVAEMEAMFSAGKKVHYQIEARFPDFNKEKASTFTDLCLPFDIVYHPDLYDFLHETVYEIKPSVWFLNNLDYCIAQGSGYKIFKGAKKLTFLLYGYTEDHKTVGPWPYDAPFTYSWDELKSYTLASDRILLEQERQ